MLTRWLSVADSGPSAYGKNRTIADISTAGHTFRGRADIMVADFDVKRLSAVSMRKISAQSVTTLALEGVDP